MATLNYQVDESLAPSTSFDPIPAGWYSAMITESENFPTKAGTGSYLKLTYEVIEGPYKGRLVWAMLNLDNPNATAVAIAQRQLNDILLSVGVQSVVDSTELHNKPIKIKVAIEVSDQWGDKNKVTAHKSYAAAQPAAPAAPAASAAPAAPTAAPSVPW